MVCQALNTHTGPADNTREKTLPVRTDVAGAESVDTSNRLDMILLPVQDSHKALEFKTDKVAINISFARALHRKMSNRMNAVKAKVLVVELDGITSRNNWKTY